MPASLQRAVLSGLTVFALTLAGHTPAHAQAPVADAHQRIVRVDISSAERNRIALTGRDLKSAHASVPGSLQLEPIDDRAFFVTVAPGFAGTTTLFLRDVLGASYRLLLAPRAMAAASVTVLAPPELAGPPAKVPVRQREIRALVRDALIGQREGLGTRRLHDEEMVLWECTRFVLKESIENARWLAQAYQLTNICATPLRISEPSFHQPGVVAVAVETTELPAGESALIYIVRARDA